MRLRTNMVMLMKGVLLCAVCNAEVDAEKTPSFTQSNLQQGVKTSGLRLILASQSEIRKRAMNILGLPYECIPADINEKAIRDADPLKMALMISEAKAVEISKREEGVIVAGDSFLVFEGKVLEKPTSLEEAYEILNALSGKKYTFVTGLAVYDTLTEKMRSTVATCDIYLRPISQEEIVDYCNRYPVLKLAGAHEGDGVSLFAQKIEGSCINETAIPLSDLRLFLREIEVDRSMNASFSISRPA